MSDVTDRITARLDAIEAAARYESADVIDQPDPYPMAFSGADPAAVLRMVAGLRAVVELHEDEHVCPSGIGFGCTDYDADGAADGYRPCPTLLAIAAMFPEAPAEGRP